MKKANPAGGPGCVGGIEKKSDGSILHITRPRPNRPNIVTYHRKGLAADFCGAIRAALDRESRLARQRGMIMPDALEGIASAWLGRP